MTFVAYRPELIEDILVKPEHCGFLAALSHSTESDAGVDEEHAFKNFAFHTKRKARISTELDLDAGIHLHSGLYEWTV